MRLTKIYTKIGDKGKTMLATGEKVAKYSERIEAYGAVDELNSFMGELIDYYLHFSEKTDSSNDQVYQQLRAVQQELFDLGGELATPNEILDTSKQQVVTKDDISRLENEIDNFNEDLEPLKNFVLPGGHLLNSKAHICRTVCRRAERLIVKLSEKEIIREEVGIYINRLSDWFFVFSRFISKKFDTQEILWNQKRR
jgi:cob(I)alamin adenosyltransferase